MITIKDVTDFLYQETNIKADALKSKSRSKYIRLTRQIAMYICRTKNPKLSYPQIGRHFNRHHSTVIHAMKAVRKNNTIPLKILLADFDKFMELRNEGTVLC